MVRLIFHIVLIVTIGPAQQLVVRTQQGTTHVPVQTNLEAAWNASARTIDSAQAGKTINIIVEFSSPSLLQQRKNRSLRATNFVSQHALWQQQMMKAVPDAEVKKSFSVLFNALSVTTTRHDAETISALPEVKRVYEDLAVTSTPYDANTSVVQSPPGTTAATGKGIKIGIIDTGIDYMHEALGKGFGTPYAVAGGYDFVNNDSDPMDDNGHGTHVAGIIAGNSNALKGAALHSIIFAYKALDAQGNGKASDVIAAIEQAIADSVSIINMSLGSVSGNPNDVLCEAVNRAVESGIVVVVAAGNAGDFESVNSPGLAERALTVGASDGNSIASFSSKGPVSATYDIKPDIVAPGVGIVSAKPGGGYVAMSGTSMATPYVTAIAALIKELHPGWSPEQIKHAIISSAKDLNTSLFAQGNGKAEIASVIESRVITIPSHINFGFDDPSLSAWSHRDTVAIFNTTNASRRYSFAAPSANPAVTVGFIPPVLDIPANDSRTLIVSLEVNNAFLTNNKKFSDGYTGKITGTGTDTVTIPYTFFKGNTLQIEYSTVPWQVLVHNRSTMATTIVPKGTFSSLVLNAGTYDIVTSFFGSYYVIKEGITVSGRAAVQIDKKEAVNEISLLPVNENDASLTAVPSGTYSYVEGIVHKSTGHSFVGMGGGMMNTFRQPKKYISHVSDRYTFAYAVNIQPGTSRSYTFDIALDSGIAASRQFAFRGDELQKVEMKYSPTTPAEKIFPLTWSSFVLPRNYVSVTFYDGNDMPLLPPYIQTAYYSNRAASSPIYHFREAYRY